MVLCFKFVIKTALACFCYCWPVLTHSIRGFFCSLPHSNNVQAGAAKGSGKEHGQDRWPQQAKVIFHTRLHHALQQKAGKRRKKRRIYGMKVFVFPSNNYRRWSPTFLVMAEPAHKKWWMNSLSCCSCVDWFIFSYSIVFISTHEFSPLYPFDSLPLLTGGEWVRLGSAFLPTGVKL